MAGRNQLNLESPEASEEPLGKAADSMGKDDRKQPKRKIPEAGEEPLEKEAEPLDTANLEQKSPENAAEPKARQRIRKQPGPKKSRRFTAKPTRYALAQQKHQKQLVDFAWEHRIPLPLLGKLNCCSSGIISGIVASVCLGKPKGNQVTSSSIVYDPATFNRSLPTKTKELLADFCSRLPADFTFQLKGNYFKTHWPVPDGVRPYLPTEVRNALTQKGEWIMSVDLNQVNCIAHAYEKLTDLFRVSVVLDLIIQYAVTPGANLQSVYRNPSQASTQLLL